MSACQFQSLHDNIDPVIFSGILEDGNIDSLSLVSDYPAGRIKFPVRKDGSFHQEITYSYPRFVNLEINRFLSILFISNLAIVFLFGLKMAE